MKYAFSILIIIWCQFVHAQDHVTKTDGTTIKGKVIAFQNNRVTLVQDDDTEINLPKKAVAKIEFDVTSNRMDAPKSVEVATEVTPEVGRKGAKIEANRLETTKTEAKNSEPVRQPAPVAQPDAYSTNAKGVATNSPGILNGFEGRMLLQSPAISETTALAGRVAVEICLNTEGVVTNARFKPVGSTTLETELITLAVQNALKFRFSKGKNDDCGQVIYYFNMN